MKNKTLKKLIDFDEKIKTLYYALGLNIGYDEGYICGMNKGLVDEYERLLSDSKNILNLELCNKIFKGENYEN